MVRYILILWSFFLSFPIVFAYPPIKFKRINSTNGLPHNTVFSITQDTYGFMWFGTRYGLARYDGYGFKTFNSTNSILANHTVRDLVAKNDSLYYLASEGGLYMLNVRTNVIQQYQTPKGFLSSRIVDLAKGQGNTLWVATEGEGVYRITSKSIDHYTTPEYVISIACTSGGSVYLNSGGDNPGLFIFDTSRNRFRQISESGFRAMTLMEDNAGTVWVGTQGSGVYKLDKNGNLHQQFKIGNTRNSNIIRTLLDNGEELIAATEGGLTFINKNNGKQHNFTYSPNDKNGIADNALYSLCKDSEGGIWIGSYFRGISYIPLQKDPFESYPQKGQSDFIRGSAISSFYELPTGNIMIASEDRGISVFNSRTASFLDFPFNKYLTYNNIHDVCYDEGENIWVGMYLHGIDIFTPKGNLKKRITNKSGDTIHSNSILRLLRDRNGNIHIGTVLGASVYDVNQQKITRQEITHSAIVRDILEDSNGNIWYISMNRGIFRFQPESGRWTVFNQKTDRVPTDKFVCAREGSNGVIWFGTEGFGLLKFDSLKDSFEVINTGNGLPNNYIFSVEYADGYLWIGTTNGLCRYKPETGNVKVYTEQDGLTDRYFNYNASRKMSNGDLYFGTINGFFKFNPSGMASQKTLSPAYITSLRVSDRNQETVMFEEGFSLLSSGNHQIKLPYKHNNIRFGFTALSYNQSSKIVYKYMLEGFDSKWNLQIGKQQASYGNLPPGKYVFKLLVSNGDDIWLEKPIEVSIIINPPFWKTLWAWALYTVLLISFFVFILRYIRQREKVYYRNIEVQKRQEAIAAKVSFFTNLTHEIKTPLSLLKVPIEVFREDQDFPEHHRNTLAIMDKNASWLENLVNELLEFQKIGEEQYELKIIRTDLVLLLENLIEHFNTYAQKYNIELLFLNKSSSALMVDVDPQALLKAISNLLVNAFKYTRNRVVLSVRTDFTSGMLRISVHDNGHGIAKKHLDKVLEPFTQFGNAKQFKGVGIGLAYAQSLINLHNGTLELHSKEGSWCVATIRFPQYVKKGRLLSVEHEGVSLDFKGLSYALPDIDDEEWFSGDKNKSSDNLQAHVLIVEDTVEIAYTLVSYFKNQYRVGYCKNGASALSYIEKFQPDIVISDVVMPEMDGIELCDKIKGNRQISHIQVILLTAKTTVNDRIVGLEAGADAYINKPFLLKEVALTIKNLLNSRVELSNLVRRGNVDDIQIERQLSVHDSEFIKKVSEILNKNLDNSNFNTDYLSDEIGMSKTLVYIKLKKLLNRSPNEYLLDIRFNKAKELLSTNEFTVAEIGYKVGFSDPNYFSRAFKQHEGMTPTIFRKNNRNRSS